MKDFLLFFALMKTYCMMREDEEQLKAMFIDFLFSTVPKRIKRRPEKYAVEWATFSPY